MMVAGAEEEKDSRGEGTGIEAELESETLGSIADPFNPEDIDVVTRMMTVDLLLSRARSGMVDLQPEFQRRWGIWDQRRQSRLIESMLLRIPLPNLYAAEDEKERWEIVDGIQRLSTIARFIDPQVIYETPLVLSGLEYLKDMEGKTFRQLPPKLALRLRETELVIHLIRRGTPPDVKFNIFARINTGGVVLSSQELRHAIVPGPARALLESWAKLPEFIQATDHSIRSIRMDDRELVLRYLAFTLRSPSLYKQADMDGLLIKTMKDLNGLSKNKIEKLKAEFVDAMLAARKIFGNDAFRKRYREGASRLPINKALFEAISVNLGGLSDSDKHTLVQEKKNVRLEFIHLCSNREFDSAISQGTGDPVKVQRRFFAIKQLFASFL
jgi:ribosomal protein S9